MSASDGILAIGLEYGHSILFGVFGIVAGLFKLMFKRIEDRLDAIEEREDEIRETCYKTRLENTSKFVTADVFEGFKRDIKSHMDDRFDDLKDLISSRVGKA